MAVSPSRVRTRLADSTSSSAERARTSTPARIPMTAAARASLVPRSLRCLATQRRVRSEPSSQ
jgi:hypothetical protein